MADSDSVQLCTFGVHNRQFGVPITFVREIVPRPAITRIPLSPAEVGGYSNIRGQVYLSLDLRMMMGYPAEGATKKLLVLFKDTVGKSFGLLVDRIHNIKEVLYSDIIDRRRRDAGSLEGSDRRIDRSELVRGVCKLDSGLIIVLKPERLLEYIEVVG